MKPQCETVADCLVQLARVMREFGFNTINDALKSDYVRYFDNRFDADFASFSVPEEWSFAIARLKDKPVFMDTENLYHKETGIVSSAKFIFDNKRYMSFDSFSWTPPKQTVTLKVGDNEPVEVEKAWLCVAHLTSSGDGKYVTEYHHETYEAAEQFRKAMKPLVKE